ncbi:hypothetical protein Syun_016818 [Stephania yunnanensis]|uniref:Protein kinase domain-containing protein n=1 Tax=Stephania yunnanensis TaxID=152371 RepID=A0AAP0P592_9MAGN
MKIPHTRKPLLLLLFILASSAFVCSASTIAVSSASPTICAIVASEPAQRIECYQAQKRVSISPNISYDSISAAHDFFCAITSGGYSVLCWNFNSITQFRRIYFNLTVGLRDLTVGIDHVCALERGSGRGLCWRGGKNRVPSPDKAEQFDSITSGRGFSCGVLRGNGTVRCWGDTIGDQIETQFGNISMKTLVAGDSHVCGLNISGFLMCRGRNDSGQINVPSWASSSDSGFVISGLALGASHTCAVLRLNGTVVCWGDFNGGDGVQLRGVSFESIAAGSNYTCGLTSTNLSVICWGDGWPVNSSSNTYMGGVVVPLPKIVPGPCTQDSCSACGVYPDSNSLCSGSGNICKVCEPQFSPLPLSPNLVPSQPSSSKGLSKKLLAFAIVGSVGVFVGLCSIVYCLWSGICCGHQKIHNSVQPTIIGSNVHGVMTWSGSLNPPFSRSSTIKRQTSHSMKRQRSGTSSKHLDKPEEFPLSELAIATNYFSLENKIGGGSFGSVYKGKLADGREVAVKRGEAGPLAKKLEEKESAFESELAFLCRLHHKHLVGLVGFCEEGDERLLVYEYMKNGSLYDHLHLKDNVDKSSSLLNSWKTRIKISLDAARGIEYLHSYAVPPIIHRDIKSSNILLDANYTAKVSDFGLSLMWPEMEGEYMSVKAAGTVGYVDPEYYGLNVLTVKSDVYGLGVVLLELLTGRRAIFKDEKGEEGGLMTVVDYAVPRILAGELWSLMDSMVGVPEANEAEAVELVAYTALHCVNLEGKERPTMSDIVANLERAYILCNDNHVGTVSSATLSPPSE